ncbi:MAG: hypothetical protein PHQ23_03980 [Candidatus Wallbacteria bacterium]|nr:hypothetical protein [Candidatus Wallbacteria bacterium]
MKTMILLIFVTLHSFCLADQINPYDLKEHIINGVKIPVDITRPKLKSLLEKNGYSFLLMPGDDESSPIYSARHKSGDLLPLVVRCGRSDEVFTIEKSWNQKELPDKRSFFMALYKELGTMTSEAYSVLSVLPKICCGGSNGIYFYGRRIQVRLSARPTKKGEPAEELSAITVYIFGSDEITAPSGRKDRENAILQAGEISVGNGITVIAPDGPAPGTGSH